MKKYTPEEKLKQALRLYSSAKELKKSAIKQKFPKMSEKEIDKKVKEFFLYARN